MSIIKYAAATVLLCVNAAAQTNGTFLLTSSNTVSPTTPTTTIEIWASWDGPAAQLVFGAGDYDLSAIEGEFSNPVIELRSPFSSAGLLGGNVVSGAIAGQLVFSSPHLPMVWDNPILLASYGWSTTDFSPRAVNLLTSNTDMFRLFRPTTGEVFDLVPNNFTPGGGVITVVPAPTTWLVFTLPLIASRRRQRG